MSDKPDWAHIEVAVSGGVAEVRLHSNQESLIWAAEVVRELIVFLAWAERSADFNVVILTGSQVAFCNRLEAKGFHGLGWRNIWALEQRLLNAWIDFNKIVIAAVNGPATVRSDLPVSADIVLACHEAVFSDSNHFRMNVAPGDGVQLIWGEILGASRAGYFLLTGEKLGAQDAKKFGAVHEIHDRDHLLPRARQIAADLSPRAGSLLSYTKAALRLRRSRPSRWCNFGCGRGPSSGGFGGDV
ncbi:enoyl-CoA hydratase/isomerase family protein [Sphingopyxis macrogoltabida]|uniref:enoyl-CoA hydratase/isomerase family protein n=1 Tax=Sphingopyxis macrogoltabida TaxID=33050 RepID=UPI0006ED1A9F|nr:enoyl-CoA hydratase/isomerase family protein [Sphingopyxis macrogoltabida]ALJ16371.1 enoyl-CoA hydratase/isomerase [Sphingopyxis macrogoltabida]